MTDDQFITLCNVYGFAPSRSLRELLDTTTAQAVISEREACAKIAETAEPYMAADLIRARGGVHSEGEG